MNASNLFLIPSVKVDSLAVDYELTETLPSTLFAQHNQRLVFTCSSTELFTLEQRQFKNMFEIEILGEIPSATGVLPSRGSILMFDCFVPQRQLIKLFERRSWAAFNSLEYGVTPHEVKLAQTKRIDNLSSSIVAEVSRSDVNLVFMQTARNVILPGESEMFATLISSAVLRTTDEVEDYIMTVESIEPVAWSAL